MYYWASMRYLTLIWYYLVGTINCVHGWIQIYKISMEKARFYFTWTNWYVQQMFTAVSVVPLCFVPSVRLGFRGFMVSHRGTNGQSNIKHWDLAFGRHVLNTQGHIYTVWCHYNGVNFFLIHHKRHAIACLLRRDMGCLLCIQTLLYILPPSLQWCMQYPVILNEL